ncbi:MAG: 30S ribosomal protein S6 [Deltaproteobacteria bacterium]|nr:30S ribosomal protein S6 [Deltaproteobacteria bacterium]
MNLREYELTVIARPDLSPEQVRAITEKIVALVTAAHGTILHMIPLGKRTLAYEIEKETRGLYLYWDFVAGTAIVKELEQYCRFSEAIIRFLTVMVSATPNVEARKGEHEADLKRLEQYFGITLTKPAEPVAVVQGA